MYSPKLISPGCNVAVVAPSASGVVSYPVRLDRGIRTLEHALKVTVTRKYLAMDDEGYLSGTTETRANLLIGSLTDDSVGAVFTTYGGFNSTDLLPRLERARAKLTPKVFVGYSDTTALLLAYQRLTKSVVFYGPAILSEFGEKDGLDPVSLTSLKAAVCDGQQQTIRDVTHWTNEFVDWGGPEADRKRTRRTDLPIEVWRPGIAFGPLFGGNISTLNYLIGTRHLDFPESCILVIEATDDDAQLPNFRRSLSHLANAGLLNRVSGLAIGKSPDSAPKGGRSLRSEVLDVTAPFSFPIIANLPFGHALPMVTLPLGLHASLHAIPNDPFISVGHQHS